MADCTRQHANVNVLGRLGLGLGPGLKAACGRCATRRPPAGVCSAGGIAARGRAALREQRPSAADDKGKEVVLLATVNVWRSGALAARPGSWRRISGRSQDLRK
jgi:hypothetical protein